MLQPTIQNINKEFDKLWFDLHGKPFVYQRNAKKFLNSSLKQLLLALLDELPKDKEYITHEEEMIVSFNEEEMIVSFNDGYNSARSEITTIINKKIEEL